MALLYSSPTMPSFDQTSVISSLSRSPSSPRPVPQPADAWVDRSFFHDSPGSPPTFPSSPRKATTSRTSTDFSDTLAPPPQSPYPQFVDPSPVESNGTTDTDTTEIDDDAVEQRHLSYRSLNSPADALLSPLSPSSLIATSPLSPDTLAKLDTSVENAPKGEPESGSKTVVSAPIGFRRTFQDNSSATSITKSDTGTQSPTSQSEHTVVSPNSPNERLPSFEKRESLTSPINTDVPAPKAPDRSTPRAQTRQELDEEWTRRKMQPLALAGIPEGNDADDYEDKVEMLADPYSEERKAEILALNTTLNQAWILCNSMGDLSSAHRVRLLNHGGKADISETAWRSCWKLCQNLYDSRDQDPANYILPTLNLCREFCQAVFEARRRENEAADSVLRVSFELNNHLYNVHDRTLPPAFHERTLDFYVTLCHRLVRQPNTLPDETGDLLRACWDLAEILFNIRQGNRDGKSEDDELLHSAIDACWELCDRFRDGWTRNRPDRSTPKPAQSAFSTRTSPSLTHASSLRSLKQRQDSLRSFPPETPTTIFDDTADPMDSLDDDNVPNILVLGPSKNDLASRHKRWPSSASSASGYSSASHTTGTSTAGPLGSTMSSTAAVEKHMDNIRILLVKAATTAGFVMPSRSTSPPMPRSPQTRSREHTASLVAFVKTMPRDAFGPQFWQLQIVPSYRKIIQAWPLPMQGAVGGVGDVRRPPQSEALIPASAPRRASGDEIARAVTWMMQAEQWRWLGDLFRVTFGSYVEEALGRSDVIAVA